MFELAGGPDPVEGKGRTAFLPAVGAMTDSNAQGFAPDRNVHLPAETLSGKHGHDGCLFFDFALPGKRSGPASVPWRRSRHARFDFVEELRTGQDNGRPLADLLNHHDLIVAGGKGLGEGCLRLHFHLGQLFVRAGGAWWKSAKRLVPAIFASSVPCCGSNGRSP